jgi:type IV pilus assembly protein PilE
MNKCFYRVIGFHLIELLVVVAIICTLATLSFPHYSQYFVREKRLEAIGALTKLAFALEQYYVTNNTYEKATLATLKFSRLIIKNNYELMIQSTTDDDYLLIAKPLGNQAKDDKACGALTLNSYGQKGAHGHQNVETCWRGL